MTKVKITEGTLKVLRGIGIGATILGTAVCAILEPFITKKENQRYIDEKYNKN